MPTVPPAKDLSDRDNCHEWPFKAITCVRRGEGEKKKKKHDFTSHPSSFNGPGSGLLLTALASML